MYRDLLVLRYASECENEAMPVEQWNELVKFADWLDRELFSQSAQQWWPCPCGYAMPEPLQVCVKCGSPRR